MIGAAAMIHAHDHKTPYLIDPRDYLGPKRRKLLDESWADLFRQHILAELPVQKIATCYTAGFGRPTKEINAALGALILQQMHDMTDEETLFPFSFNLQWHYALDIPGESDEAKYLSAKTLDEVSRDLFSLVERFREDKQVRSLSTFGTLLRVLKDRCDVSDMGEMTVKASKEIASSSLQNPWRRLSGIVNAAIENLPYSLRIAA